MKSKINYAECVDWLVSTMPTQSSPTNSQQPMKDSAPFDTPAYQNYKAQVDKQREKYAEMSITEMLYDLGYKIDTALGKIIDQLDTIIKDDFKSENVTCTIDDKEVDMKECTDDYHY